MATQRILLVHNSYKQPGGEDIAFTAEADLLKAHGHIVIMYTDTNARLERMNPLAAAITPIWSSASYCAIRKLIKSNHPDVVHFHNTFMMISPSAYYACHAEHIPVVQTLHNFRLLCPVAIFFRNSQVCEDCLGKGFAWPGVYHACYHTSRLQTAGIASMVAFHRLIGTWRNLVNEYIVLTDFSRRKFMEGRLAASNYHVKPNFIAPDPGVSVVGGDYALFVGRLSVEKGTRILLDAWKTLPPIIPLKIIGKGPLVADTQTRIDQNGLQAVELLGTIPHPAVLSHMKNARFLVFPSECYEGFPMVIAESYAVGKPVIASRLGSMEEIVHDGETGLLFTPGDAADLAAKVVWLWNHPEQAARMGENARREYENRYTPERNYRLLMEIYEKAIGGRR